MKHLLIILFSPIVMLACSDGYIQKTISVDTDNIQKYPAGMVINGYTLPPEPNKVQNNKTLLGVDSNHNGIRDDVERFIIISNSKLPKDGYPKTWTAIKLQDAKANFSFIKSQTEKNAYKRSRTIQCQEHFIQHGVKKHSSQHGAKKNSFIGAHARQHFINQYSSMNTEESYYMTYRSKKTSRWYASARYKLLSSIPEYKTIKEACDVDLTKLEEW
ncbi:MAG TPA: hypothetical protein EYG82_07635 [Sulfurovum sp.]|nr:hypothetical protein [Sulfurovum sp.]